MTGYAQIIHPQLKFAILFCDVTIISNKIWAYRSVTAETNQTIFEFKYFYKGKSRVDIGISKLFSHIKKNCNMHTNRISNV